MPSLRLGHASNFFQKNPCQIQKHSLTLRLNQIAPIMNKQVVLQILAEYFKTQPVLKAWLFGSFARGEENLGSDVDILVVLDPSKHVGLKFFGMWNDLERLLDRKVDLVTEHSLADFARDSVERDKILIYERAA